METFTAIDFETANHSHDSACAIGVVVVSGRRIVKRESFLIRPPSREFTFSWVHGLTWDDVRTAPTFRTIWPKLKRLIHEGDFLAAHNAKFDRSVLNGCCESYGMKAPDRQFVCTMQLARAQWGLYPTKLPDVCNALGLDLEHHNALSDAEACARIVVAAQKLGWKHDC